MKLLIFIITLFIPIVVTAQTKTELATERYFESVQRDQKKLDHFLKNMPKGGDLHSHLDGTSMAENMIHYAKWDNLCIDQQTFAVYYNPACCKKYFLQDTPHYPTLYNALIDAWSMRNFYPGKESGHDHFFATFDKYKLISLKHSAEMLSEVVQRACQEKVIYLELMVTPDNNASGKLGGKIGWDCNLTRLREKLLKNGLKPIIIRLSKQLDANETLLHHALTSMRKKNACADFKLRYLYQVLREQPPAQVFAQLLAGFELASQDPRVVGINMVQAEDGKIAMRDYTRHMHMVEFLHRLYPRVHISLHAGELVPGLVPDSGLCFHIREAVKIAHAQRIGHGVDIMHEDNAKQLLQEMAKKKIMVEINLSSNAAILGIKGKDHPLLLYRHYRVPVALSTDDEGVLRTNLTEQYKQAILSYHFSYLTLKRLARNSIHYSFLSGHSLWCDDNYQHVIAPCSHDLGFTPLKCQQFLKANPKANLEWELEQQFIDFENQFA